EIPRRAAPPEDGARRGTAGANPRAVLRWLRRSRCVRGGSPPRSVLARRRGSEASRVRRAATSPLAGGDVRVPPLVAGSAAAERRPRGGPRGDRTGGDRS